MLDIHTDFIESPELVRDRILHAVEVFGGPDRLQVVPDCGLRTRSWDVAYAKLVNMVAGVQLAKAALRIGRAPRRQWPGWWRRAGRRPG